MNVMGLDPNLVPRVSERPWERGWLDPIFPDSTSISVLNIERRPERNKVKSFVCAVNYFPAL